MSAPSKVQQFRSALHAARHRLSGNLENDGFISPQQAATGSEATSVPSSVSIVTKTPDAGRVTNEPSQPEIAAPKPALPVVVSSTPKAMKDGHQRKPKSSTKPHDRDGMHCQSSIRK